MRNKTDLHGEFLSLMVPIGVKLPFVMVDFQIGDFKGYIFIRFGGKNKVLVVLFRGFYFLFEGGHDSVTRCPVIIDFRKIYFKE